jgi:hypothetical protein
MAELRVEIMHASARYPLVFALATPDVTGGFTLVWLRTVLANKLGAHLPIGTIRAWFPWSRKEAGG